MQHNNKERDCAFIQKTLETLTCWKPYDQFLALPQGAYFILLEFNIKCMNRPGKKDKRSDSGRRLAECSRRYITLLRAWLVILHSQMPQLSFLNGREEILTTFVQVLAGEERVASVKYKENCLPLTYCLDTCLALSHLSLMIFSA